jgi:hypothetical protein
LFRRLTGLGEQFAAKSDNRAVDPIVLVIAVAVLTPIAVIWALAKSASLRGPLPRPEGRRPVQDLVTDAVPEAHPEDIADDAPREG